MPIYEYKCTNGHVFEVMQSFSDDPLTECQVCGASVQKVFYPVAIHFKGSGFHNTDYGTRKRAREQKEASSSESGGSTSSEKSESKTAPASSGSGSGSAD